MIGSRIRSERIQLALLLSIVVVFAMNTARFYFRIDMTESKAFSISPVSRSLFQEIQDELQITYYVSERLQSQFPQPQEIIDLLGEYAATSRGTIRLDVVDPADGNDEDRVEQLGIIPQQLQVTEEGEQTYAVVYSGIVITYLDRVEAIPFLFETSTLEYEITSTVRKLVRNEQRNAAILALGGAETVSARYTYIASRLAADYDIRTLGAGEPIPDDVDVLLVIAPEFFDESAVAEIRSYLDRGGAALIAVDRVDVSVEYGFNASDSSDASVFDLLSEYGITLSDSLVVDESYNQIVIQERGATFTYRQVLPYPLWVSFLEQYSSSTHPITARFTGLDLYWASYLEIADEQAEAIVASTPQAWLANQPFILDPQSASILYAGADETRGQYTVVAAASGDGESGDSGRLVVVADSDFLNDQYLRATNSGQNLEFAQSAAQWLSNDEDLLEIRTRLTRDMRLNKIDDPTKERFAVLAATIINVYAIPLIVIMFGVRRFAVRRRRSRDGKRGDAR
jgi:ABC-type uncharacterized transport system involved in gliding motility auxiliary subunit